MTTTETIADELAAAIVRIRGRGYENGARGAHACRLSDDAAEDVPYLLARLETTQEHLRRAEDACQLLGRVVTGLSRSMEAARIQMLQVGAEEAMEWILQSLPDVDDNDPDDQWNGTETAQEWFDRTDERQASA